MKRNRKWIGLSFLCIASLLFSIVIDLHVRAQEEADKAIVFVMDASGSMKTNDPQRLAVDSTAQLIYTLPSNFKVGFVAYNGEVAAASELVDDGQRSEIMKMAENVPYAGYSNAGEGLAKAVSILTEGSAQEKSIVLLSDGEVLIKEKGASDGAVSIYRDAIEKAQKAGITIYVIGLGDEMKDSGNTIFEAAEKTQGQSYFIEQASELQNAIDMILTQELGVKQSTVAVVDADGGTETVSVDLPYAHADKIRVVLTANAPICNLTANFHADSATQINGSRYSLIEIENPAKEHLELRFESTQGNMVRVNVIPEYRVLPKIQVLYEDSAPLDAVVAADAAPLYYNRTATLSASFYRADNPDIPVWGENYFDYTPIVTTIDGEAQKRMLQSGALEWSEAVTEERSHEVVFDYSSLPINVMGEDRVSVDVEAPPLWEQTPPEPNHLSAGWIILGVFLALVAILALVLRIRRQRPIPPPAVERPEPSKYSYVGRINLYITRTSSGYDISPLSYNLFRLPSGKVISLQEILDGCEVKERFPGAENIYFKAGTARNLILTNDSDCTIIRNREILMKKKSYSLAPDAKVDVAFEDEISELTLQYKV